MASSPPQEAKARRSNGTPRVTPSFLAAPARNRVPSLEKQHTGEAEAMSFSPWSSVLIGAASLRPRYRLKESSKYTQQLRPLRSRPCTKRGERSHPRSVHLGWIGVSEKKLDGLAAVRRARRNRGRVASGKVRDGNHTSVWPHEGRERSHLEHRRIREGRKEGCKGWGESRLGITAGKLCDRGERSKTK